MKSGCVGRELTNRKSTWFPVKSSFQKNGIRKSKTSRWRAVALIERALRQRGGIVGLRYGMQVHDRKETVVLVLEFDPVLDRAQVVADVQLT